MNESGIAVENSIKSEVDLDGKNVEQIFGENNTENNEHLNVNDVTVNNDAADSCDNEKDSGDILEIADDEGNFSVEQCTIEYVEEQIEEKIIIAKKEVINELDLSSVNVRRDQNDDGEIVSDGEPDADESKTEIIENDDTRKEAMSRKRLIKHESAKSPSVDGEPNNKKSALEHLRNMKFAKRDPFGDSSNRDSRSFRYNRSDRSPVHNSTDQCDPDHDKRKRFQPEEGRKRYRRSDISPYASPPQVSESDSIETQQKRQRSTMYLLRQKDSQNSSHQSQLQHQQQLPGVLKNYLPTTGQLRQKIDSLMGLPDEQVYSLSAMELKALLIYTVELSLEQDRLLAGRKAQLKELDQMIQKEQGLIDRIVNDLPSKLRPNFSDVFGSPSDKSPQNSGSNGTATSGPITSAPPPSVNFNVPPPSYNTDLTPQKQFSQPPPSIAISSASAIIPTPNDFSQPPPLIHLDSSVCGGDLPTSSTSIPVSTSLSSQMVFTAPPPVIPSLIVTQSTASIPSVIPLAGTSVPPPNVSSSINSVPLKISNLSTPLPNLSAPPPNLSAPPLNLTASLPNLAVPPPNLSAPPPTVDFSVFPSANSTTSLLSSNNSSPAQSIQHTKTDNGEPISGLKTSHSSSSLSNLSSTNISVALNLPTSLKDGKINFNLPPPNSTNFSVPPPVIPKSNASVLLPAVAPSTNIAAALDLSVPPPQINKNAANPPTSTNTTVLPNFFHQPPLCINVPAVGQNLLSTSISQQQTTSSLLNTNSQTIPFSMQSSSLPFLQQQQSTASATPPRASGPVPLMSIEQLPPPGFMSNRGTTGSTGTGIRSLASIVQQKQQSIGGKRNQGKRNVGENNSNRSQKHQNAAASDTTNQVKPTFAESKADSETKIADNQNQPEQVNTVAISQAEYESTKSESEQLPDGELPQISGSLLETEQDCQTGNITVDSTDVATELCD